MAQERKKGFLSHYLLSLGEAIQFRPFRALYGSNSEKEERESKSAWLMPYKRKIKTALAKAVEQSFFFGLFRRVVNGFFTMRVRSLGILLFTCGFLQIFSFFIGENFPLLSGGAEHLILGSAMTVLTLFCSFSRFSVGEALKKSLLFRVILGPVFNVKDWQIPEDEKEENLAVVLFFGIFLAFLSVAVSPAFMLFFVLGLIFTLFVLARPEAGLFCSIAFLPIFSQEILQGILILSFVSFLMKCCVGKRSLIFSMMDLAVIFVLSPVLFFSDQNAFVLFLSLFSAYFLGKCLLRTAETLRKLELIISLSSLFCGLSLILRYAVTALFPQVFRSFPGLDTFLFLQPREELCAILAMMLPFVLGRMRHHGTQRKAFGFITLSVLIVSLVLVKNPALILAWLVGILVYCLMSYRAGLLIFSILGLSFITVLNVLPKNWVSYVLSPFGGKEVLLGVSETSGFLSVLAGELGFTVYILLFILLGFFLFSCFRFTGSLKGGLYFLVLGAISSVAVMITTAFYGIPFDSRVFLFFFYLMSVPEAARFACGREKSGQLY